MIHTVTFFPKNISVDVERNATVMEAALKAGIHIESACGGQGVCGKCKVIVSGPVDSTPSKFIDKLHWENGYRLACQSKITGDLVVFVPQETVAGKHKILSSFQEAMIEDLSPLVISRSVELPAPSLDDNIADLERLGRELGISPENLRASRDTIRKLPVILRENDWKVTTIMDETNTLINLLEGRESDSIYGIAVDIGTTTVVVALVDLKTGEVIAQASDYNRQILCGEDVLSRIAFTEEYGVTKPHRLILDTLNDLVSQVIEETFGTTPDEEYMKRNMISCATVAGNTTMIHLFMGIPPKTIRYEPYIPVVNVPPLMRAGELGLDILPEAPVFIIPGRAGYVGGDIIADVLASEMYLKDEVSLLIDVGTNGEIVLGSDEWMVACSCSAGPAFEGGEVTFGMRAMTGAIDSVTINKDLEVHYTTINHARPKGICGSGLIDLLAEMFMNGILDRKGHIRELPSPRIRKTDDGLEFIVAWAEETAFWEESHQSSLKARDIVITENDIKNVIRTKAAVYAGCCVLLKSMNMTFDQLDRIYVAGGFGNYLDVDKAKIIGLLPDMPQDRYAFIGNGALAGARLALLSGEKRKDALKIYEMMTYFELSTTQKFFDEFSSSLFLPHTDISQFPYVEQILRTRRT